MLRGSGASRLRLLGLSTRRRATAPVEDAGRPMRRREACVLLWRRWRAAEAPDGGDGTLTPLRRAVRTRHASHCRVPRHRKCLQTALSCAVWTASPEHFIRLSYTAHGSVREPHRRPLPTEIAALELPARRRHSQEGDARGRSMGATLRHADRGGRTRRCSGK